jgi:hypothetical protein
MVKNFLDGEDEILKDESTDRVLDKTDEDVAPPLLPPYEYGIGMPLTSGARFPVEGACGPISSSMHEFVMHSGIRQDPSICRDLPGLMRRPVARR